MIVKIDPCFSTETLSVNGSAGSTLFGLSTAFSAVNRSAALAPIGIAPVATSWSTPCESGRT